MLLSGLNACGNNDEGVKAFVAAVPKALAITGGNGQTGFVTAALKTSLTVALTDANGLPVIGSAVAWAVKSGGGKLSRDTVTTDAFGKSTVSWTLGNAVGTQSVTANPVGQPTISGNFTATAVMPNFAIDSGNNQTAAANDTVAVKPRIIVTDAAGAPAPGVRVDFAIASGGGFLSGGAKDSAQTASIVTDSKGEAAITWVLGSTLGNQTMTATVAGATPLTFTAVATPPPPAAFSFDALGRTMLWADNHAVRVRVRSVGARSLRS